ncbi:MAG: phosphoglycerate dehydrogenase [Candidatus Omnitrophota bacterium]
MKERIAITLTSFAEYDTRPMDTLKKRGLDIVSNAHRRTLAKGEIPELCAGCAGIIAGTEPYDSRTLAALSGLKVISRCGAGTDNVDLDAAGKMGIKVFNTPDGPTEAVAELTVGLIFSLARHIARSDRDIRNGVWNKRMGGLINGKKAGIVGFGRIGRRVAEILRALGAEVVFYDPLKAAEKAKGLSGVRLEELLKGSDIVTLHIPYTKDNHHVFSSKELSLMKEGAVLINASRGGIVDEEALYGALKSGRLSGAAVDVFEKEPYSGPLKELDNVVLTPHIGSYARESRVSMELEAANNLIKGLGGR